VGLPPTAAAPVAPVAPPQAAAPIAAEPPSEGEQRALERARLAATPPTTGEPREDKHHADKTKHAATAAADKASSEAASKPDPVVSKPVEKPKAKGGSSIDDLLDGAIGSKAGGAAKHEAAAAANLPDKPTRDDVLSAMNGVKDAVKACAKGAGGVAIANITVAGKSGRVSNVEVSGITGDVGSCIAKAVRKASFPKFKADDFQVKFPFRL
jgi:hypothetical protein